MTQSDFEAHLTAVAAGEPLPAAEIERLAAAADILPIGMLADELRRQRHGARVTYVRTALCPYEASLAGGVPPAAREVRLTGTPPTLEAALAAVASARAIAGDRIVSGLSWNDITRLASAAGAQPARVLGELRSRGLDAVVELALDEGDAHLEAAIEALAVAGFERLRLTVRKTPIGSRQALFAAADQLQRRYGCIQALNPLPSQIETFRPTTGYEDVKAVALARLAAPSIPTIQVDWMRYGPKLAQVALTFGADDLDAVTASDDAPDGRRRAPLEEVRRNIEAAGFMPAERDGAFRRL